MSQGAVAKLWMVTDGEWVPMNPTHTWFKGFLHGLLSKSVTELANGTSIAPRTKYAIENEKFIVEWKR